MRRRRSRPLTLAFALAIACVSTWAGWRTFSAGHHPSELPEVAPLSDAAPSKSYAGSRSCLPCHRAEFDKWASSHHARAETTTLPALDFTTLSPERPTRVMGVAPLLQFIVSTGGRQQVHQMAYDPEHRDWFSVYGKEDRKPGEWGHWTGRGMSWNSMCAYCHNTALEKNYDPVSDSYRTTMAEVGVGCEACHGPAQAHIDWRRQHPAGGTDPTLVAQNRKQTIDTCGTCHARRVELTDQFRPGNDFADHFGLATPDAGENFYADGQVHEEDYEFTSFVGSRMFRAGVACQDCHDAHGGKTRLTGDALCMRCHSGGDGKTPRIDPSVHSFHSSTIKGGACVDCHMPETTYMQRHARRDHGFTIPDPRLTRLHKIPNACSRCHADKSAAWAEKHVDRWYGPKVDRPTRARAETVVRAREGDVGVIPALRKMIAGENVALWRAVALRLSERFLSDPDTLRVVIDKIGDDDALVRASAARTLESALGIAPDSVLPALQKALGDRVRSVRLAAAWSLRATIRESERAFPELIRYLDLSADQPMGQAQRGAFELARGHNDAALTCFERAVSWDPGSAPLRHELAVAYAAASRQQDAVTQLKAAVDIAPSDAHYRFALGLAQGEAGNMAEGVKAFEQAVHLDPHFARAWYNLALVRAQDNQFDAAFAALDKAEAADPREPSYPFARASMLFELGKKEPARRAAKRALEIDPHHKDALALLNHL